MKDLWFGDFVVDVISDFGPNSTLCDEPPKDMPKKCGPVGFVREKTKVVDWFGENIKEE